MKHTKTVTKYLFSTVFVLLAMSLAACSDNNNLRNSANSDEPVVLAVLSVTSTGPANEELGVGTNSKVVAVFNKAVKAETVNETSFMLQGENEAGTAGAVTYDADTTTASFKPGSDLTASTLYTATITAAVEDEAGDSLVEKVVWTFTTGDKQDETAPQVDIDATTPKDGENPVLRNIKLNIVFNEAIDPVTVTAQSVVLTDAEMEVVAGTLSYINPTTVVFSPDVDLVGETLHKLTLQETITDLAGNSLALFSLSFTTGVSTSTSPAVVELGAAGNYVLLAKTGISTTGTTDILGDIAVSPAALSKMTGFNETLDSTNTFATSDLVTGKLFAADMAESTPATLTTAVGDMENAYTNAAGRSADFTELGAGEIGGMTLDTGVYNWGTGVLVTSDVTLNGSSTDVWIFQIAGGLKLQDGKSIILTGGALPENVFWQVADDVTLQAGTTFNGIILGQTGVNMNSGAVLNGRALVQTAVTLIGNDINQPAQ